MKYSFEKDWLERNVVRLLILSEEASTNLQDYLIVYLVDRSEMNEDKIADSLNLVSSSLKQTVMNAFEVREKRGERIGEQRGFESGSQKTRRDVVRNLIKLAVLTDDQIASVADITIDFVINVRAELKLEITNI